MVDRIDTLVKCDGPIFQDLASHEERAETFKKFMWPIGLKQKPNMLSEAGFFYTGSSDKVICFYCNGGLQNWEPRDSPLEEHAKYYPDCGFLNLCMPPGYVSKFHDRNFHNSLALRIMNQFKSVSASPVCSDISDTSSKNNTRLSVSQDGRFGSENTRSRSLCRIVLDKILRRRPKNSQLCKICHEHSLQVVFLPCSHLIGCPDCSVHLTKCPICRDDVKYFLRVFM
ncbi:MAG: hypothetical protein CXT79_02990 [Thaumarchaeota archaeon]|nr:MAG: hypothetical protein CXT79_02990 [Nitrososphaerota archaeon]